MNPTMTGNEEGVALWNRMTTTQNALEADYFQRVALSAQSNHRAYFVDCVKQAETGANQPIYLMTWDAPNYNWAVSLFYTPDPKPVSPPKIARNEVIEQAAEVEQDQSREEDAVLWGRVSSEVVK